jgi:membrane-bound lytic murein transglycosylase D
VQAALAATAMLVSGCFHAGPSVKQAMTSAAAGNPATQASAAPSAATGTATQFDLHKPEVESTVALFQNRQRDFFDSALGRSGKYVPTMTDILVREGLPAELAYVPLIESGYRPLAVSRAGAVGPWQFIPETGKRYGLRIDSLVDERRDPIKSTHAAVQYLKDLHGMFGDWELSLAAYNSGENRVARILERTSADDFWDMRERGYLPDETSEYVPRFLAAVRIASAPEHYGFDTPVHAPFDFETVHVDRQVSLRAAAGFCGVKPSELAELNPALRRDVMPSGYALRVPTGTSEPLRVALANYEEPARPARKIAKTRRSTHRSQIAKAGGHSQYARKRSTKRAAAVASKPKRDTVASARELKKAPPRKATTRAERPRATGKGAKKATTPSRGKRRG